MAVYNGHRIKEIIPESIAEEMGIEPDDILLRVNNHEIEDVFDYRYYMKEEYVEILILKPNGEEWLLEIDKDYDEELGVVFENGLMSGYKSCNNRCIFCFIDQMPPGMRETLYFKDDDSRLSFLQGNYITLTNMKESDIKRIVEMKLAPVNISVHTTNPELRCMMLNNRFAGKSLKYIDMLYENNIEMNGQIVLCKGINDGVELEKSINDLSEYIPYMKSVSVVPAGMTKYRDDLYPLEMFDGYDACKVIDFIEAKQEEFYKKYGTHFVHASDEWYINAGRDFPDEDSYDGYVQLENGVGMMRLFIGEANAALEKLRGKETHLRDNNVSGPSNHITTIPTGELAFDTIRMLSDKIMERRPGIKINVIPIHNEFFGEKITVTGLITGTDLIRQLKTYRDEGNALGYRILIPSCMIKAGEEVFLDDVTIDEVERELGTKLVIAGTSGYDFVEALTGDF